jgi:CubicO group peptidase (beta-lactamase class C family)
MDAEQAFKAICDRIPDAMTKYGVPGVAIGIVADDREFTAGFGVTNVEHPLTVDEDTFFQIGSTTKTLTATAVMRLVEEKKLALDDPITKYLPNFRMRDPEVAERVTMRHLLTHVAGWQGDFFEDTGDGDDALAKYVAAMAELPQITPLGAVWSYNNAAFSLAGRVIEVVTGKTYEQAMLELVLKPLDLRRSYFFPTYVMTHRFVSGHASVGGNAFVLRPWQLPRSAYPAGGIVATIKDQLRYARFHLGDGTVDDGERVLSRESIAMMQTPQRQAMLDNKIGLAWWIRENPGLPQVQHGGATLGQISSFVMFPSRKFAIAMATNASSGGLVFQDASREPLEEFLAFRWPRPEPIAMTPEQLSEYVGRYTAAMSDVELELADGGLVLHSFPKGGFPTRNIPAPPPPPPVRLAFVATDRVALEPRIADGAIAEFLRDGGRKIEWLRIGGRIAKRVTPVD